jgi:hypothetical protein
MFGARAYNTGGGGTDTSSQAGRSSAPPLYIEAEVLEKCRDGSGAEES